MPTYVYVCTSCEERLSVQRSIHADPLAECPACAGALRRVYAASAVGVTFRGGGFYRTDSRASRE